MQAKKKYIYITKKKIILQMCYGALSALRKMYSALRNMYSQAVGSP